MCMRSPATSPATPTRARKSWCRSFAAGRSSASSMSTARARTASIRTMPAASRRWSRSSSKAPTSRVSLLRARKSGRGREHRLRVIERRKDALEIPDLRQVVVFDVGRIRMMHQIILVIALCRIEPLERLDACRDRPREGVRLVQLRDVALGDTALVRIGDENRGAVLAADIGTLAIELRRVVHDGKCDLQQLAVRDLGGI